MSKISLNLALQKEGLKVVKLLESAGFKAFWVGGTVRDLILERPIDNLDIATSATPDQTEQILQKNKFHTKPVGKVFGTILAVTKHGPIEITTFRSEGRYINRRKPEKVEFIDSHEEDSKRRDFTINALYYDPHKEFVSDPQNGQLDIERKLIRFVGDPRKRIDEDALRMLRAIRFSIQLGFKLEKRAFAAIKTRAKYIQRIPGERVKAELDKILAHENKHLGVRLLDDLGLLKYIFPDVVALKKIYHLSKKYHLEGNAFEHTMLVLKNTPVNEPTIAYAALFHDTGKYHTLVPKIKPEGKVNSFWGHEFVSEKLFSSFAKKLKFSRQEASLILWITKMHMTRSPYIKDMSEQKKLSLAKHKYFPELIKLWRADAMGNLVLENNKVVPGTPVAYQEGIKWLDLIRSKKNLINKLVSGEIILKEKNIRPGPLVGKIKNQIENKIYSGEINNLSDVKKYLKTI